MKERIAAIQDLFDETYSMSYVEVEKWDEKTIIIRIDPFEFDECSLCEFLGTKFDGFFWVGRADFNPVVFHAMPSTQTDGDY